MKYRPDIDGLRSFAVLSVLFFHINVTFMPGGFTGVDIFFVISGYLITSILIKEIQETSRINLWEFYRRRIKRILPSFFIVAAVSAFVAYIFLLPEDLITFGKSLRSTLSFASNRYFAKKNNYFDPNSDEFPLLHTWSLAVEEQFYFIWPLLLFLLLRIRSYKKIAIIILLSILSSTIYAQFLSENPATAQKSYFYLFTRIGELLVGCFIAYLVSNKNFKLTGKINDVLAFFGLVSIIASFYVITKQTIFPGYWALLPCVGAALIIWTGHYQQGFVHKFLSLKPFVWIGLHSYAIYLWHWPILAFYRYLTGNTDLGLQEGLIVTGLSFGLSYASRALIEKPCNHTTLSLKKVTIRYFALPSTMLFAVALVFVQSEGLPKRIKDERDRKFILSRVALTHWCDNNYETDCWSLKDPKAPKVVIMGDSHGAHMTPFMREVFSEYNVYSRTTSSCPPILNPSEEMKVLMKRHSMKMCVFSVEQVGKTIEKDNVRAVFLAGRWVGYLHYGKTFEDGLVKTITYLKGKNIKVYFLHDIPSIKGRVVTYYYRRSYGPGKNILPVIPEDIVKYEATDDFRKIAEAAGAITLKPYQSDKLPDFHLPFYKDLLIYRDGHHLTKEGSQLLGKAMKDHLRKEIQL